MGGELAEEMVEEVAWVLGVGEGGRVEAGASMAVAHAHTRAPCLEEEMHARLGR